MDQWRAMWLKDLKCTLFLEFKISFYKTLWYTALCHHKNCVRNMILLITVANVNTIKRHFTMEVDMQKSAKILDKSIYDDSESFKF